MVDKDSAYFEIIIVDPSIITSSPDVSLNLADFGDADVNNHGDSLEDVDYESEMEAKSNSNNSVTSKDIECEVDNSEEGELGGGDPSMSADKNKSARPREKRGRPKGSKDKISPSPRILMLR